MMMLKLIKVFLDALQTRFELAFQGAYEGYSGRIIWHFIKIQVVLLLFFLAVLVVGLTIERIFR